MQKKVKMRFRNNYVFSLSSVTFFYRKTLISGCIVLRNIYVGSNQIIEIIIYYVWLCLTITK